MRRDRDSARRHLAPRQPAWLAPDLGPCQSISRSGTVVRPYSGQFTGASGLLAHRDGKVVGEPVGACLNRP